MIERAEDTIDRVLSNMPGWCTPEKGKRLAALAMQVALDKTPCCVELGVFGGRSLVSIALGLAEMGRGHVDGIDPYTRNASLEGTNAPENDAWWGALDYEDIARSAQESIYRLGVYRQAHLIRMRSLEVAGYYHEIDLLHQDSNHSEEISCEEVRLWAPKMTAGGIWIFDDTNWPTTQKAQRELEALGFKPLEYHETWRVFQKGAS